MVINQEEKSKQWIDTQLDEMRKKGMPEWKVEQWRQRYEYDERHSRVMELGEKAYETKTKGKKSEQQHMELLDMILEAYRQGYNDGLDKGYDLGYEAAKDDLMQK